MYPIIDKRKTGIHLRRLMEERELTVRDIQQYLGLGSVQSVYHWLNGISMPTVDNLGEDFLAYVKDGMTISVAADGTVTVEG